MPMTRDKWNKYNMQRTNDRHGWAPINLWGYRLTRMLDKGPSSLITEHLEIDQLRGSARIRYRA